MVIELEYGSERHRTPLTKRYRWGSAGRIPGRALDADSWVAPTWRTGHWSGSVRPKDRRCHEAVEFTGQDMSLYLRSIGDARPTGLSRLPDGGSSPCLIPESACKPFGSR